MGSSGDGPVRARRTCAAESRVLDPCRMPTHGLCCVVFPVFLSAQLSGSSIVQHLKSSSGKKEEGYSGCGAFAGSSTVGGDASGSTARRRSRKTSSVSASGSASLRGGSDASHPIGEAAAAAVSPATSPQLASLPSVGPSAEPSQGALASPAPSAFRLKWLFLQSLTLKVDYNVRVLACDAYFWRNRTAHCRALPFTAFALQR
jgi:hypothetical protein